MAGSACRRVAVTGDNCRRTGREGTAPPRACSGGGGPERARTPDFRGTASGRRTPNARAIGGKIQRLARAHPPDRSARVREGEKGDTEFHRECAAPGARELASRFRSCPSFLGKQVPNFGIERTLEDLLI